MAKKRFRHRDSAQIIAPDSRHLAMVGIKPTLRMIAFNLCFWPKPVLAVKHFPAVIPGLADGETRATRSLHAVRCAMLASLRSDGRTTADINLDCVRSGFDRYLRRW